MPISLAYRSLGSNVIRATCGPFQATLLSPYSDLFISLISKAHQRHARISCKSSFSITEPQARYRSLHCHFCLSSAGLLIRAESFPSKALTAANETQTQNAAETEKDCIEIAATSYISIPSQYKRRITQY